MASKKKEFFTFYYLNFIIQPVDKQSPGNYITFLQKVFAGDGQVRVHGDREIKMGQFNEINDNGKVKYLEGELVSYINIEGKGWFNTRTNRLENVDIDSNLHPNPKIAKFYFDTSRHLLAVESKVSVRLVKKYFEEVANIYAETLGYDISVHIVANKDQVARMIESKNITRIVINITYSNGDNEDLWADVDRAMKETNVRHLKLEGTGTRQAPIQLTENEFFKDAALFAANNGTVMLTEHTDNGNRLLSNVDIPRVKKVIRNIGESIMNFYDTIFIN